MSQKKSTLLDPLSQKFFNPNIKIHLFKIQKTHFKRQKKNENIL